MKSMIALFLMTAAILIALTGCGAPAEKSAATSENGEASALTVRIVDQSALKLYSIAASYSFDGETLGSKVCERIEGAGYEFTLLPEELPAEHIGSLRIDLFAAERAGEDFFPCGSATIELPQTGAVYTLTLSGDSLYGLVLRFSEG
ncbi:MAG: hypothetical protein II881_01610 [Oscillospiraceae bacterium]|nr:hypothetical protein [Oscillospiraceae bacterium]